MRFLIQFHTNWRVVGHFREFRIQMKCGIVLRKEKSLLSKWQKRISVSFCSYSSILALAWPCLDITSQERNVNGILPNTVTAKLPILITSTLLCSRATWSFPCTRHTLWLRFGGWRCVCAPLLFQASGAPCDSWDAEKCSSCFVGAAIKPLQLVLIILFF